MNKKQKRNFELIKGQFTAEQAKKVLVDLVQSKVSFHGKEKLRSFERTGKIKTSSEQRINELKTMREEILQLIDKADEQETKLNIKSEIQIEFASEEME